MATIWTAWLDDVMPELPGAPQALALYHVKRAAIEFMTRSGLYTKTTALIPTAALPGDISPPVGELPADQQVLAIKDAWWNGKDMGAFSRDEMANRFGPNWPDLTGDPVAFLQQTPTTLRLVPQPASTATMLRLAFVYGPNESATGVPDEVFNRYREPIAFGAKARMMLMSGKPWSNEQKALGYQSILDGACENAKLRAIRGSGARALTTKPHAF